MKGKTQAPKAWTTLSRELERVPMNLVAATNTSCHMPHPHWHAQAEVNFLFSGRMTYRMPHDTLELEAGDVSLFWGGQPHQAIAFAPGTELVVIHLPLTQFFRLRLANDLMQRLIRGAAVVTRDADGTDATFFRRLTAYMLGAEPAGREHAVEELLLRINRVNFEPFRVSPAGTEGAEVEAADVSAMRNVMSIFAFVAEHFRETIRSTDVASFMDIHPKYAMNVFKKSTGMTLNEYVTLLRLSYAQSLLMNEELTILDIAMESGFGSLSAFGQSFRKIAGCSPSEFRRRGTVATSTESPGRRHVAIPATI